jgi:hypothetical protein
MGEAPSGTMQSLVNRTDRTPQQPRDGGVIKTIPGGKSQHLLIYSA